MSKVVNYVKREKLIKKYLVFIFLLLISALNYNIFLQQFKIVAGGSSGLALIFNNLFGFKPSSFILIFQSTILLMSFLVLGIKKSSSAFLATLLYPLFVEITIPITENIIIDSNHIIIVSILSGIISGITTGYVIKIGLSQGGISLVSQMIFEKFKISFSKVNTFLNLVIILVGGLYFGIETLLCAIILTYVSEILIDRILLGISSNKIYYIVTNKDKEIVEYILKKLHNSVTIFETEERYDDKKVLMLVVNNSMYYKISETIKEIDKDVFYSVVDAYQISVKK